MNLKKFKFPKLTMLDISFSILKTDPALLKEAKKRGFYNGHTPYNDIYNALRFAGAPVTYKDKLDEDFKNNVLDYIKAFSASFVPTDYEKEAICAMFLSEIIEPEIPA